MSQRDGFAGGFILGTLVGGVVGGVVGALLTARQLNPESEDAESGADSNTLRARKTRRKRSLKAGRDGVEMETARRRLEDKIAQLNDAIDDVRQQLGGVNGTPASDLTESSMPPDPRSST
jgi:hypothetical protein